MAERAHPEDPGFREGSPYRAHLFKRYAFANRFAAGKVVLDIPCGVGWGTSLLSASRRIGMDISVDAIAYARAHYPGMEFLKGDMANIPLADGSVEVVVCLEGFEHVDKETGQRFLSEAARVVKPDGLLVMTVPIIPAGGTHSGNRYHLHEPSLSELKELVGAHFSTALMDSVETPDNPVVYFVGRSKRRSRMPETLKAAISMDGCERGKARVLLTTSAAPTQSPFSTSEKRPPLGIGFLISSLRQAGHDVHFIDNYLQPSDFLESGYLQQNKIDFVGVYANTICYRDTRRMFHAMEHLRQTRQWQGKILVGGPHTSVSPQTIPDFVDYVVQGEGERAIVDIVAGKVTERIVRYPRIENLDELPMPAWDCFVNQPYKWEVDFFDEKPVFTMNTSRGCPFSCTFCSVGSIWGKRYTCFSADRIVADIEHVMSRCGAKGIYFREDNFTLDTKRLRRFCELMIEKGIRIPWVCESRVSTLTRELVELMVRAGLRGFYFGVESGSQRMLDFMKKGIAVEQTENAFKWCHELGVKSAASIVVGVPTETAEDLTATQQLLNRICPVVTWKNVFVGIPDSPLYRHVLENRAYEFIDDRGLVYLRGHNDRVRTCYRNRWNAEIPDADERKDWTGKPKVSVLMAVYNGERFLREALTSIYRQTYQDFEVVIVDDGSTDRTPEILLEMKDARTSIYRNPSNIGLTRSLNVGLKLCRGDYVARMDADDLSDLRRFDAQVRFLDAHPRCLAVGTWCHRIDAQGRIVGQWKPKTTGDEVRGRLLTANAVPHGSAMIRRKTLMEAGGYNEAYPCAQDYDLWLRLSEKGDVENLPEQLYSLRFWEETVTAQRKREQDACAERARCEAAKRRQSPASCPNPLDEIAIKHGTDKSSAGHDYMTSYYRYFAPLRHEPIKLLEIGINQGYSLRTWHEFFPRAEVFAIDINPACRALDGGRVHVFIGDQADPAFLRSVAEAAGGWFDIVIDDGGHFVNQQIVSFNTLLSHVVPGGIYVIEDLHTSYWPSFGGGLDKPDTAVNFLKGLVDVVNRHGRKGKGSSPAVWLEADRAEAESPAKEIESIEFCRSMCFVVKKSPQASARVRMGSRMGEAVPPGNGVMAGTRDVPAMESEASGAAACPGLSVILTTYNRPELLKKVMEGFARQTAPRESFEVVVVDDGSTPPVRELVESFADRVQVLYVYQENSGLAAARNAGIRAARGEILLFSDDDDVPSPELVAEHRRSHRENPDEQVAVLGHLDWHPDLRVTALMHYVTHVGGEYFGFDKLQDGHFYNQWKWWGGLISCKRSLLQSVKGPFDRRLRFGYEDTELVCRLQDKQIRVLYNAKARSWILRPVLFQDFCRRCVLQGRALQRVAALHPEIISARYHLHQASAEYHERFAASLEEWTGTVDRLEARLKSEAGPQGGIDAQRLRTLYGLYGQCFRGYLLQGYVEECQAVEQGVRTMADDVNASSPESAPCPVPVTQTAPPAGRPLNITFVNTNTPGFDVGSSNVRIYHILKALVAAGHRIDHLYQYEYPDDARYMAAFSGAIRFIRVGDKVDHFRDYLRLKDVTPPDCVWITNLWTVRYGQYVLELTRWLKQHLPQTKIVLDTMDFHHKKFVRQFALSKDPQDKAKADAFLELERQLYPLADVVVVVTDVERQNLLDHVKADLNVAIIPNIHRVLTETPPLAQRKHVCYLGAFRIKHNLDAVRWFQDHVLPLILKKAPDCEFHLMGYGNQEHVDKLKPHPNVRVIGYVEDAEAALSRYRLFVCPMVYGSGMKGKMGSAAGAGTPIVTTTIGAEGFGLTDGRDCFIADDPQVFADRCLRLLRDDALWHEMSDRARRLVTEKFGVDAVGRQLLAFMDEIVPGSKPAVQVHEPATDESPAQITVDLETRYKSMSQQSQVKLTTARRLSEIARRMGLSDKSQTFACEAESIENHLESKGLLRGRHADQRQPAPSTAEGALGTGSPRQPKVTVITACHNAETFLRETLDSIRGQTLPDWELFLMDDASQDGTRRIIEEYAQQDARIRPYFFDTNEGPYVRRNFAIRAAHSDFVVIHDADDLMLPNKLEVLHGAISRDDRLAMVGSLYRTFMDNFKGLEYTECSILPLEHDEIIAKFQSWQHAMSHGSAIIRRSMFDRIGPYDANPFASDSFWSAKLGNYTAFGGGVRVKNVADSLTLIRMHATNQTRLLSIFDPRNRRIRFRQYCELKLQNIRKKMASTPGIDLGQELRDCKCDDFLTRFKAEIVKWESQPPDPRLIEKLLQSAVMLFNGRFYVSCINVLNGVEGIDATLIGRITGFELLRGMALYALTIDERSRFHLDHEIQVHDNPAAHAFLAEAWGASARTDVQDWCERNARKFQLGLANSQRTPPLQNTDVRAITPERSACDGTTRVLAQK